MIFPRLDIDLDKIQHNARTLVDRLAERGVSVMGCTKATLGSPEVAAAMLRGGVSSLGDSRIENIEAMQRAGISSSMTLVRSPMLSQVAQVVAHADVSLNSELDVISKLSAAAEEANTTHGIVLMVELGDLREGIMPLDLTKTVRETLRFPNITFKGIGTNLACRNGIEPDAKKMAELSDLADAVESTLGPVIDIVSGGNSGNLRWALSGEDTGRINHLRLGEAILLGRETLQRRPIDGLHTDAFALTAEVIESKSKPSLPWGTMAENAFGENPAKVGRGEIAQVILGIGRQDTDPYGLTPPPGIEILGSSSDHLIVDSGEERLAVGDELSFEPNYSALLGAMTSPFVVKVNKSSLSNNTEPALEAGHSC